MVSQSMVDDHVRRVESQISGFGDQIKLEVELIAQVVSTYLLDSLSVENGVVQQTPENSTTILEVELVFNRELTRSGFYSVVVALVSDFVDQVEEFREMYEQMGDRLPEMELDSDDREVLANQAAAAIGAIEGQVFSVNSELRQRLSRSLGGTKVSDLVNGVIDVVRKLNRVESIAHEQTLLWFKLLSYLVYQNAEEKGHELLYKYAGPPATRAFCGRLMQGDVYTREEIAEMDNGQVPDVFINGGGYGCKHFWVGEAA